MSILKHVVTQAEIRYKKNRQHIYLWRKRYDGTVQSLEERSYRPHNYPKQHTEEDLKLIQDMRRQNPHTGLTVTPDLSLACTACCGALVGYR